MTASAGHEVVDRRRIELSACRPIHYESWRLGVPETAALVAQVRPPSRALDELVAAWLTPVIRGSGWLHRLAA